VNDMKNWIWIIIVLVVAIVLLAIPWGGQSTDTIKIGVTAPLTGPIAHYGLWAQRGLDLAVSEINANGGIKGKQIGLVYEDDKCKPDLAVNNVVKFTTVDNIKFIVSVCSAVTPAVAESTKDKGVVFSPVAFSISELI